MQSSKIFDDVANGEIDILKAYINEGKNCNIEYNNEEIVDFDYYSKYRYNSLLTTAVKHKQYDCVKLLLAAKAKLSYIDSVEDILNINDLTLTKQLIDIYDLEFLNKSHEGRISAVMCACICDLPEVLKMLIEKGCDINKMNYNAKNALSYAINHKSTECVKILLNANCSMENPNNYGCCRYDDDGDETDIFYSAILSGNIEIIKLLINKYPMKELNYYFKKLNNLNLALFCDYRLKKIQEKPFTYKKFNVIRILIESGCDLNIEDGCKNNVLLKLLYDSLGENNDVYVSDYHLSNINDIESDSYKNAIFFIDSGININLKNKFHRSFLHLVCENGYTNLLKYVIL